MPKETFWDAANAVENDGVSEPVLTITWSTPGTPGHGTRLNDVDFDRSGINRLIRTLRRARDATHRADE